MKMNTWRRIFYLLYFTDKVFASTYGVNTVMHYDQGVKPYCTFKFTVQVSSAKYWTEKYTILGNLQYYPHNERASTFMCIFQIQSFNIFDSNKELKIGGTRSYWDMLPTNKFYDDLQWRTEVGS